MPTLVPAPSSSRDMLARLLLQGGLNPTSQPQNFTPLSAIAQLAKTGLGAFMLKQAEQDKIKGAQQGLEALLSARLPAQPLNQPEFGAGNLDPGAIPGMQTSAPEGNPIIGAGGAGLIQALAGNPETLGTAQQLALSLAGQSLKPETFGQPMSVTGPEGNPRLARFGNRGGQEILEGVTPKQSAQDIATPLSKQGKQVFDRELFVKQYGEDSPQVKAFDEALGNPEEPPKLSDVSGIRKEFTKLSGDFVQIRDSFKRINGLPESAAGDVGLIFNIMKMFDPGSTVREGEFATAQNAAGVPERVAAMYNRLLTGERLTSKQRGDFRDTAASVFIEQRDLQVDLEKQFSGLAGRQKIDPQNVLVDFLGDLRKFERKRGGEQGPNKPKTPDMMTNEELMESLGIVR